MPLIKALVCIAVAGMFAAQTQDVRACSYSWRSIDDEVAAVDYVFAGTVVEVDTVGAYIAAVIEVEEVWKGRVTSRFEVWTPASLWVCGFTELHRRFETGWKLLLFAQEASMHVPGVNTWAANRSMRYEDSTEDLEYLGQGHPPVEGPRVGSESLSVASAYPNPARNSIAINFGLDQSGVVEVNLYDMLGRRVSSLASRRFGVGRHVLPLRLPELARSTYLLVVHCGAAVESRVVTVLQ